MITTDLVQDSAFFSFSLNILSFLFPWSVRKTIYLNSEKSRGFVEGVESITESQNSRSLIDFKFVFICLFLFV